MKNSISFLDKITKTTYHKSKKPQINVAPIQFFAKYIFLQKKSKGEFMLKEGEVCDKMYYLETGLVKVFSHLNDSEVVTWFTKEGEFLTLVNSFVNDKPSHESIEVLEDITYYAIPKNLYFQLIGFSTQITLFTMFEMLNAVCEFQTQTIILRTLKSKEKYHYFLENYPDLFTRINQKDLASFIGLEETYLSRLISEEKKLENKKG